MAWHVPCLADELPDRGMVSCLGIQLAAAACRPRWPSGIFKNIFSVPLINIPGIWQKRNWASRDSLGGKVLKSNIQFLTLEKVYHPMKIFMEYGKMNNGHRFFKKFLMTQMTTNTP